MNGTTDVDETLNPCTARTDRHTYGCRFVNICFWGKRLVRVCVWRFVADVFWARTKYRWFFTMRTGNAWSWHTPIGSFTYWW